MGQLVVIAVTFVIMEPVTYAAHRWVMHGVGLALHRSHHRRWNGRKAGRGDDGPFEANDLYPVLFGSATVLAFALGLNVDRFAGVVPICIGITLYGATYAFVHDVYIHGRLPFRRRSRLLDHLADAHALHHRFGGEPYGMLAPVVPASVRERAARADGRPADPAVSGEQTGERVVPVPGT